MMIEPFRFVKRVGGVRQEGIGEGSNTAREVGSGYRSRYLVLFGAITCSLLSS